MVFLLMAAGAFLFSALFNLYLAFRNYEKELNTALGMLSFFIMVNACASYIKSVTGSLDEWIFMEKFQNANLLLGGISILYFLRALSKKYLTGFFYLTLSVSLVLFFINLVSPFGIAHGYVASSSPDYFSENKTLVNAPSVWNDLVVVYIFVFLVFITAQLLRYYKTGDRKMAVSLIIALGFIGVITAVDMVLTAMQLRHIKNLPELAHLVFIFVVMRWNIVNVLKSAAVKAQLVESEFRHREIYENSLIGIYRTTPDGEVLMANPALVKLLGLNSKEELYRQKLDDAAFYKDYSRSLFVKLIEQNGYFVKEIAMVTKDKKEIYVRENARAVRGSDGHIRYIEGTLEDITERKNIERELIRAKEAAEESERLKSDFLAQMSHEIRTPISTVLNFMNLINEELSSSITEEVEAYHSMAVLAGKRLIRTIDQLLNMAQLQNGTYEPQFTVVNLNKIVTDLIHDYQLQARAKGLYLTAQVPEHQITASADEYSVQQMLSNLIHNAVKYTNHGSVFVRLYEDNGVKYLDVADTGIGISDSYMKNMFMPFSQESSGYTRRYEGTGLGLALVKKYCDLNKMDIKVVSEKGKGTQITVSF